VLAREGVLGEVEIGLPIGNLTSQFLANMYLDRFDVCVRHQIKPLAYIRYGDDFVIFCSSDNLLKMAKNDATKKLYDMGLSINRKQEIIVHSSQGIHFLGHIINKIGTMICRKTKKRVLKNIDFRNSSSYCSLKIDEETKKILPWVI
jgi:RNA-directed DNA polymerase